MAPRFRGANNENYQALIWHHKIFSPIKFQSGDLTTPVAGRPPGGFAGFITRRSCLRCHHRVPTESRVLDNTAQAPRNSNPPPKSVVQALNHRTTWYNLHHYWNPKASLHYYLLSSSAFVSLKSPKSPHHLIRTIVLTLMTFFFHTTRSTTHQVWFLISQIRFWSMTRSFFCSLARYILE